MNNAMAESSALFSAIAACAAFVVAYRHHKVAQDQVDLSALQFAMERLQSRGIRFARKYVLDHSVWIRDCEVTEEEMEDHIIALWLSYDMA